MRNRSILSPYTPKAWYWNVCDWTANPAATPQLYSSASRGFITADDPTYVEWLESTGHQPTNIISMAELVDVLTANGVPLPL